MIYPLGILLVVVTYTSVTSALPPCVCTREMKPVCGSDGHTYNNMCLFNCQQSSDPSLQMHSLGRCRNVREVGDDDCQICTLEYTPLCGSDGHTYPNHCTLRCAEGKPTLVHYGACKSKRAVCICPYNYSPVCGTDGQTYGNKCSLDCEPNVRLAHNGACKAKREIDDEPLCFCTFEHDPVCGSNGRTYGNMCGLECEGGKVQLAYRGECKAKRETVQIAKLPACQCTREARPVCGTDGKTYSNPCLLNCIREEREDLHIDYPGRCRGEVKVVREANPLPTCACTRNLRPVCASNGVSYNNECLMRCAGAELTVEKHGRCEE